MICESIRSFLLLVPCGGKLVGLRASFVSRFPFEPSSLATHWWFRNSVNAGVFEKMPSQVSILGLSTRLIYFTPIEIRASA